MAFFSRLPCITRDSRGTVAVSTALAAIIVLISAGAAIDYIRLLHIRDGLQGALDSATLAAAAKRGALDQTSSHYFSANGDTTLAKVTNISFSKRSDGTVDGNLTAEMPTSFLRVAGFSMLTLRVSSAARGVFPETSSRFTFRTISGKSTWDKDFYVTVRDRTGKAVSETLVQAYNYECLCHSNGASFSPAVDAPVTVELQPGETAVFKLVVFRDPNKAGIRWRPATLMSDTATASTYLKLNGTCSDTAGQTLNWEDGLSGDFQALVVNVTCVSSPAGSPKVALVR